MIGLTPTLQNNTLSEWFPESWDEWRLLLLLLSTIISYLNSLNQNSTLGLISSRSCFKRSKLNSSGPDSSIKDLNSSSSKFDSFDANSDSSSFRYSSCEWNKNGGLADSAHKHITHSKGCSKAVDLAIHKSSLQTTWSCTHRANPATIKFKSILSMVAYLPPLFTN